MQMIQYGGKMKRFLTAALVLLLSTGYVWASPDTETITFTTLENTPYQIVEMKTIVQTNNALNEQACVDARLYDMISVRVETSGTINYDLDYAASIDRDGSATWVSDFTGDDFKAERITAPYYCYDIDSCTACTLTATWRLIKTVNK